VRLHGSTREVGGEFRRKSLVSRKRGIAPETQQTADKERSVIVVDGEMAARRTPLAADCALAELARQHLCVFRFIDSTSVLQVLKPFAPDARSAPRTRLKR
jgi:hypothetical protein